VTHPFLLVVGHLVQQGATTTVAYGQYKSEAGMKRCTKHSLGIKLSIKVENTQFCYIIALIKTSNNQILSFLKIKKTPDGSLILKIFKYPKLMVL